ncbi:hypothetical protein [Sphingomonas mesophila]|uniref:hypothetical protein n=1 Tax=Sphingomonas mesophila TaxID=2303576 RepID=UPI000E56F758|nr:hypothetical protein [Sphingomonas mesophila]
MKTIIIGAFALAFAVPAVAQTAPTADPHAGHTQGQTAAPQTQQHQDHAQHMAAMHKDMAAMHKHCQEMMKQHGKDRGAKPGTAPASKSHEDHKGH